MFKKLIVLLYIINIYSYGYPIKNIGQDIDNLLSLPNISSIEKINIEGNVINLDIKKLLYMTCGMESNFGKDKYDGRIAKSFMQIEKESANYYIKLMPELTRYIFNSNNIRLQTIRNDNAIYIAYIIYMSKIKHHSKWLNKYSYIFHETKDPEYFVYKIFYNSVKGKSTYKTWKYRENIFNTII